MKTLLGSLDKVGVQPFAKEFHKFSKHIQGTSFLQELTWLKSNNWEEADLLDVKKNAPWMSGIISNRNRKTDAFEQLKLGINEV